MARHKAYRDDIPKSIIEIVKAVCGDYERRACQINKRLVSGEVLARYEYLNGVIDNALDSIEIGIRKNILDDIRHRRGYDFSQASPFISRNTYYSRKKQLIYDIAVNLALM